MTPLGVAILIVYGLGFPAAWLGAARVWIKQFGSGGGGIVIAGAWGLLIAIVWPLPVAAYSMGRLARWTLREDKRLGPPMQRRILSHLGSGSAGEDTPSADSGGQRFSARLSDPARFFFRGCLRGYLKGTLFGLMILVPVLALVAIARVIYAF